MRYFSHHLIMQVIRKRRINMAKSPQNNIYIVSDSSKNQRINTGIVILYGVISIIKIGH